MTATAPSMWLRFALVGALTAHSAFGFGGDEVEGLGKALAAIDGKDAAKALDFLTSDECAGRDTPQPGLYRAIEFVEKHYEKMGLEPLGNAGFRHEYPLDVKDAGASCSLVVTNKNGETRLVLREQFIPARESAKTSAGGNLVFVGYGIEEQKWRWNDYSRVNPKGCIAIALTGEPREGKDEKKFFDGLEMTDGASLRQKAKLAKEKGAIALIAVTTSKADDTRWLETQLPIVERGAAAPYDLPVMIANGAALGAALGIDFAKRREIIDSRRGADSDEIAGATIALHVDLETKSRPIHNVVARYRGSDPSLSNEAVVIGAHLDHIGVDDRGRIYHGADDNAGGSAALMEIAQALGTIKPKVERSIILISFTGEEKGLLGSHGFVANPSVPKDTMIAMINLDIIARGRKNAIEATRSDEPTILSKLLPTAVRLSGTNFKVGDGGKQFFERSDHFEFHRVGIPAIFFNEGETNEDYHRWTDTDDKAIPNKVASVAKIALALACLTANAEIQPARK